MSRPTIYDLAKAAGVSLATIDRVLNARPGVREKTINRVNKAISEIGYVRDVTAANLARQKAYRLVFVLPDSPSALIEKLQEAVSEAMNRENADRTNLDIISVPAGDPHALAKALRTLETSGIDGVAVMAPETPHARDAIRRLKQKGIAVVAIVSDLPNSERDHFAGIDNIAAGRTAAVLMGRFLANRHVKVIVLAGSMLARDHVERRLGFDQIMANDFSNICVLPSIEGRDDAEMIAALVNEALDDNPDTAGIYSLGAGNRGLIRILEERRLARKLVVIAHELTSHAREALENETFDAVITQDFGHVVRSAIRMLRAKSDGMDVIPSQERIRIDIFLKENLV